MFLLGHSCWSYLFSKATGRKLNVNLPAYLALLSGILPDFDIYFQPYLVHHTYTHSLIVIIPIVLVLTYFFGRLGFAFSIGILSLGVQQGFRWYLGNRQSKSKNSEDASSPQPLG